jgi:hypothetical protein
VRSYKNDFPSKKLVALPNDKPQVGIALQTKTANDGFASFFLQ